MPPLGCWALVSRNFGVVGCPGGEDLTGYELLQLVLLPLALGAVLRATATASAKSAYWLGALAIAAISLLAAVSQRSESSAESLTLAGTAVIAVPPAFMAALAGRHRRLLARPWLLLVFAPPAYVVSLYICIGLAINVGWASM